jgi:phage tail-like protein
MDTYLLKVNGRTIGSFSEVSGLTSDTNIVEYRDGDDTHLGPRKIPRGNGESRITLSRGVISDPGFATWVKNARGPHHLTIAQVNATGAIVWSRQITNGVLITTPHHIGR